MRQKAVGDLHALDEVLCLSLSSMPEDLSSMSLLWMSFVRDVRLLWEDGAALARMVRPLFVQICQGSTEMRMA